MGQQTPPHFGCAALQLRPPKGAGGPRHWRSDHVWMAPAWQGGVGFGIWSVAAIYTASRMRQGCRAP